jgi:hypothetical protein
MSIIQQKSYFNVQKPEKSSFLNVNLAHKAEPSNLFITFSSFNQKLSNNQHDFDRLNNFERPLYTSSIHSNAIVEHHQQHFDQFKSTDANVFYPIPLFIQQQFHLNFIPTTMLDMVRGSRTTSIKTLSTLIPHAMCQSCNEMNILILPNKFLIIIQLKQKTSFDQIMTHEEVKKLSSIYSFYENNQKLTKDTLMSKGNHYIHFKGTLKGRMNERDFVYLSTCDQILKEIPVRSPDEVKFFECWIKSGVEGYVMRSFVIKRIICPTNTRFISTKEEGFDHFRNIIETRDYITKKVDKEDINEFFRKPQEKFYFIVDRFELPRASFSQV